MAMSDTGAELTEPEYLPWYSAGQPLSRCLMCGALVSVPEEHTGFHLAVARVAEAQMENEEIIEHLLSTIETLVGLLGGTE